MREIGQAGVSSAPAAGPGIPPSVAGEERAARQDRQFASQIRNVKMAALIAGRGVGLYPSEIAASRRKL